MGAKPAAKGAFVLVIRLKTAPGMAKEWLAAWAPLAAFCRAHEPNTLSYEAAISDKDADVILIYERYVTKADLTEVHQQSALFLAFRAHPAQAHVLEKEGNS